MSINNFEDDGYSTDETVDHSNARERQDLSPSSDEDDGGDDAVGDPEGNRLPVQDSQMASSTYEPDSSLGEQAQIQLILELIIPERIVHAPANVGLPIQETCQIGGFALTIEEAIVEGLD